VRRLTRQYGTASFALLGEASSAADLGRHFGADLYQREVEWQIEQEWARSAEDVLWRRTKLGLRLTKSEQAALAEFMTKRVAAGTIAAP
jgi:glycerol-3-phosphate dehydrogenase